MHAERCTLERLRELRNSAAKMYETLNDMRQDTVPYSDMSGSVGAAHHYLHMGVQALETAFQAYADAVRFGEIEEEACQ
jgi:maleate cis-trans isomerase